MMMMKPVRRWLGDRSRSTSSIPVNNCTFQSLSTFIANCLDPRQSYKFTKIFCNTVFGIVFIYSQEALDRLLLNLKLRKCFVKCLFRRVTYNCTHTNLKVKTAISGSQAGHTKNTINKKGLNNTCHMWIRESAQNNHKMNENYIICTRDMNTKHT